MAQIETWYNQDLKQPVKVHYLHGNVFSQDNQGNILGVNVFDDGSPASLSGTVSAYIVRSDGATVPATGTLSGNKASVALPEAAYAIPGIISIVMKLTAGAVVVTLLAVVATVYASSTDAAVDPGSIIPSIEDLIEAINEAVESVPQEYLELCNTARNSDKRINYGNYPAKMNFYQQAASGTTGAITDSTVQIRSQFIFIGKGNQVNIAVASGYLAHVRWYDNDNVTSFVSGANSQSGFLTAQADYLIIAVTTTSYGTITPEEGSAATANIHPVTFARSQGIIYTMAASVNKADYVNVDLVNKIITFGSASTGVGRAYLRDGKRSYQIGGKTVDFSSVYSNNSPFAFFFYRISTDSIVAVDAGNGTIRALDTDYVYIGSIWGDHPSVNLNIFPYYYVNGAKTYTTDIRGTFDANRSYGYNAYNIAVMGDSTSTFDGISESEIGGRQVRGAYYPTGDVTSADQMWWALLQKMLRFGGAVNVSAISRSRYLNDIDSGGIYAPAVWNQERIDRLQMNDNYPHYIFINVGINDAFSTNQYGEFSYNNTESAILAEPESIAKGIELTLVRVQNANPYARIVLMIPKLVAKNTTDFVWKSYYKTCELVEQIGKAYGVYKIIDLRKCGITEGNMSTYNIDGVHPNALGMKMIAEYIYNCMTDDEQPARLN